MGQAGTDYPDPAKVYVSGKVFFCPYTDSAMGQCGNGWLQPGIDKFNELHDANSKARKIKAGKKWEKDALALLKAHFNLVCDSREEERKAKRRKVDQVAAGGDVEEEEEEDIFEESDYEEDVEDDDEANGGGGQAGGATAV